MSDKNQDKPDDYDVIFDSPSDEHQDDTSAVIEDVDAEYTDIDDGDEGIFAPEPEKKKSAKSSGLLGAVALLAVVGAGGYVYYSNPDMIEQVKQNLLGSEVAGDVAPVPEMTNELTPAEAAGTPPVEEAAPLVAEAEAPVEDKPADVAVTDVVPPTEGDVDTQPVEAVAPDVVPSADDSPAPVLAQAEAPVADIQTPADNAIVPPVVEPVKKDEVVAVAPVVETAPAPVVEAPVVAKEPEKVAVKTKPESVPEDKPIIVDSPEVQKELADAKLDKYFDSPGGKILKGIPAPSMNPSKGKNESIIVVGKQPKKSHNYGQTGRVSIQMTDLDSKIVSADRAVLLQRYDAAKEMYDELYKLNPRDGRVLMGRAVVLQKTGDTEQAISAYEEVLKYNPDNAEAVVNLAGLIRKEYPAVALNKLLDLRQQFPDNPIVAAQLGVAYADSKNYPDAFHYLSMAANMDPDNPQHFYNMAVVAEKAGDPKRAIENYERALEADAISGASGKKISRERIYDRLTRLRGN